MLDPSEERVIRTVKGLLDCGPNDRRWLEGEALVWLDSDDPDRLHTTVRVMVEDWDVRVISDGTAVAAWEGEKGCAPGEAEWSALGDMERMFRFVQGQPLPTEMPLAVTLEVTEMGPEWEVCLAPIHRGHLHLPYVPTPALESL